MLGKKLIISCSRSVDRPIFTLLIIEEGIRREHSRPSYRFIIYAYRENPRNPGSNPGGSIKMSNCAYVAQLGRAPGC